MSHYVRTTKQLTLAALTGTGTLTLDPQNEPFEDVTIWVRPKGTGGNLAITPTLNGQPVTASAISGDTDLLPRSILLLGIFPPTAPLGVNQASTGVVPGITPGVSIVNTGTSKVVVWVDIIARARPE